MMDESRKKRMVRLWLGILYVSLWAIGLAAVLAAATWLLGLWRYAAFAAVGVAVGAYLSGRSDSLVQAITRAVLVLGASVFAGYLALVVARTPALLTPFGLAAGTFLLYATSTAASIRFVQYVTGGTEAQESDLDASAAIEVPAPSAALEAVPQGETETSETTPVAAGR